MEPIMTIKVLDINKESELELAMSKIVTKLMHFHENNNFMNLINWQSIHHASLRYSKASFYTIIVSWKNVA